MVDVDWDLSAYKSDVPGTYTLTGELVLGDEFENPDGLEVSVDVIVTKIKGDDSNKGDDNKGDDNKGDDNKGEQQRYKYWQQIQEIIPQVLHQEPMPEQLHRQSSKDRRCYSADSVGSYGNAGSRCCCYSCDTQT